MIKASLTQLPSSLRLVTSSGITFCFLLFTIFTSILGCSTKQIAPVKNGAGLTIVKQFRDRYGIAVTSTDDPYLRNLVDRLLQSPPKGRTWDGPYDIIIVKNSSPLAASVGDNFIIVTSGLIERLDVEAELAFILAHELAHYLLGHTSWVSRPDSDPTSNAEALPELERDADLVGLQLLINAGYDPRLARVAIAKAYQGTNMLTASGTHPSFVNRVAELEVALAQAHWMPPATVDRRAFQEFKYLLGKE